MGLSMSRLDYIPSHCEENIVLVFYMTVFDRERRKQENSLARKHLHNRNQLSTIHQQNDNRLFELI